MSRTPQIITNEIVDLAKKLVVDKIHDALEHDEYFIKFISSNPDLKLFGDDPDTPFYINLHKILVDYQALRNSFT